MPMKPTVIFRNGSDKNRFLTHFSLCFPTCQLSLSFRYRSAHLSLPLSGSVPVYIRYHPRNPGLQQGGGREETGSGKNEEKAAPPPLLFYIFIAPIFLPSPSPSKPWVFEDDSIPVLPVSRFSEDRVSSRSTFSRSFQLFFSLV